MKNTSKELTGAISSFIILAILKNRDSYGYKIVQMANDISKNNLNWREASIYPVLKKMEENGMIKSYWKVKENHRPRKYYTILAKGKKQLEKDVNEWEMTRSVLEKLLGTI